MKRYARNALTKIRGNDWNSEYAEIKSITTSQQLASFQEERVKQLLLHASRNVPYYAKILNEIGMIRNDKDVDMSKFGEIPILTKKIMREHQQGLVSTDYTKRKWYYRSSGGSTGEPVKFVQDDVYGKWGDVSNYYWYRDILGIDRLNAKKVHLWGSERDLFKGGIGWKTKVVRWWNNQVILNSFKMTEDDMRRYVKVINSYKPDLIMGYASSLYQLSCYIEKMDLSIYEPQIIVSSAETLSDEVRKKVETVMGTNVYDFYGSRESNSLAGECREGQIHILGFHSIIEILNENDQVVREGEEGRVVVTNLHNYSMPLIRYEIGDMAILGYQECRCGNFLPALEKITGRIWENFIREDGGIISGGLMTITFYLKSWVAAFQVIQEDYKRIRLVVVPEGAVIEHEQEEIEQRIRVLMGDDCQVLWDFVDEIPKTPQGKHLYVRSLVSRQ